MAYLRRRQDILPAMGALACALSSPPAEAQSRLVVDLPPMPLAQALARYADVALIQILFDPAAAQGHHAPALHGQFSPQAALARLLTGSDLEARQVDARTYLVRRRPDRAPAIPPRPAQPAPAPPAVAEADIIVTSARYRQALQRVSASVQVVPGETLREQALSNISEILDSVPGVTTSSQPGGYSINMRGLGADMPNGTTQGSVALEFDGIYSIIALGTGTGFFDVDRVEIIKGPQGTRYGPNAEGGVVNVIAHDPALGDTSGSGSLSLGNAGLIRTEVAQNVPIGGAVALRLAGVVMARDSWFTPALADTRNQSLRAKLLARPAPGTTLRLTYQIDHIGGTGTGSESGFPVLVNKVAPYPGGSINATGNPWAQGDRASGSYDPARNHANLLQQTLVAGLTQQLAAGVWLDLTGAHAAISGTQTSCARDGAPWSLTAPGICYGVHEYAPFRQNSLELRVRSAESAPLQWTLGQYFWQFGKTSWADANQAIAGPTGGSHIGTRTLALFGEATVPLTTRLRLIAGGRQSWDRRVLRPTGVAATTLRDFHHADFRLGAEYDLAPNVMEYVTLASGYRPGGLAYDGATGITKPFASETTTAFELGLKSRFFDRRLLLDLSAFAYRQRNYQDIANYNGFTVTLPGGQPYLCGASGGQPAACAVPSFNIASAHNIGLEWQSRLHLTSADTLEVSGALSRARFGSHLGPCATVAAPTAPGCWIGYNNQITGALSFFRLDGAAQPHSPTFATTIRLAHTLHLRADLPLELGGEAYHSSSYWVGPIEDTALLGFQPGYWQMGLTARLTLPGQRLAFSAWLRNLTNYAVKMSTLPATTIGEPRNFGATLVMHW